MWLCGFWMCVVTSSHVDTRGHGSKKRQNRMCKYFAEMAGLSEVIWESKVCDCDWVRYWLFCVILRWWNVHAYVRCVFARMNVQMYVSAYVLNLFLRRRVLLFFILWGVFNWMFIFISRLMGLLVMALQNVSEMRRLYVWWSVDLIIQKFWMHLIFELNFFEKIKFFSN